MDRKALEEEIRRVAYELYEKSGCIPGRDLENWLEAERIVLSKYGLLEQKNAPITKAGAEEKPKKGRCGRKSESRQCGKGIKKERCKKS
ncbi:MAG: DUF2934 domain-containing protein [Thermodesulfobacterium sp.]|nr:DUF2934 domain-containing protein [Thermodesulfobacterium sp.]